MGNDILREIVAVETELLRKLEAEKERAHVWIEKLKKEAEEEVAQEEERSKEECARALRETKAAAESKAARIVEEAAARAGILGELDSEFLREIVMKHITRIFPG